MKESRPSAPVLARQDYVRGALDALRSPYAIAAIVCLLLNDHVLKTAVPSDLTGKLSDVSGLFFFPLLIAIALGAIPGLVTHAGRVAVAMPFVLTALVFLLLKTDQARADIVREALTPLFGAPPVLVADPTDLVALGVLPLGHRLFKVVLLRPSRDAGPSRQLWRGFALSLAAFASVATSSPPPPDVLGIASHPSEPGALYALARDDRQVVSIYRTEDGMSWRHHVTVDDGGTADMLADPSTDGRFYVAAGADIFVVERGVLRRVTPGAGTLPDAPTTSLQILDVAPTGTVFVGRAGGVARSDDGGATWHALPIRGAVRALRTIPGRDGSLYALVDGSLMRSDDDGANWDPITEIAGGGELLAVDPREGQRLLLAVAGELRASPDGGRTWQSVLRPRDNVSASDRPEWTVVFDPDEQGRVYATFATAYSAEPLYVSTDGGSTWRASELPAQGVAIRGAGELRLYILVPRRGVYRQSLPWPRVEPWQRSGAGLPVNE